MINYLGKKVKVIIDRPKGSKHPKFNHIYPINYGYIPNTVAGDEMEIDAYILGVDTPVTEFTGYVIAIIKRSDDVEDKLVVSQSKNQYLEEEIRKETHFQEKYFKSTIIKRQN